MTIRNDSDRVRVSQTLAAPSVISPDFLFGRNAISRLGHSHRHGVDNAD